MKHSKIIASINERILNEVNLLESMVAAGVDIFRINMSYTTCDKLEKYIRCIRNKYSKESKGILVDLQGPKMRVDYLENNLNIKVGEIIYIYSNSKYKKDDIKSLLIQTDIPLSNSITQICINDGKYIFEIIKKDIDGIFCRSKSTCTISSYKSIHFIGLDNFSYKFTDKDKTDIKKAIELDVDMMAISYIYKYEDISLIRNYISSISDKYITLVSKIETENALKNIESIIEVSDSVMVARGDLAIETDIKKIGIYQREIIKHCYKLNKPVIIATQLLESMIDSNIPSRSDVSDITSIVNQSSDCLMLSMESCVIKNPIIPIKLLNDTIISVEEYSRVSLLIDNSYSDIYQRSLLLIADRLINQVERIIYISNDIDSFLYYISRYPISIYVSIPYIASVHLYRSLIYIDKLLLEKMLLETDKRTLIVDNINNIIKIIN